MRSTFGVLALAAASEALIAQPKDTWYVAISRLLYRQSADTLSAVLSPLPPPVAQTTRTASSASSSTARTASASPTSRCLRANTTSPRTEVSTVPQAHPPSTQLTHPLSRHHRRQGPRLHPHPADHAIAMRRRRKAHRRLQHRLRRRAQLRQLD